MNWLEDEVKFCRAHGDKRPEAELRAFLIARKKQHRTFQRRVRHVAEALQRFLPDKTPEQLRDMGRAVVKQLDAAAHANKEALRRRGVQS